MNKQVVFIASLGHSGSTLLDLILGCHPRYIGVGEIFQLFQPKFLDQTSSIMSSSGKTIDECDFWQPLSTCLRDNQDKSALEKYQIFLEHFQDSFGETCIPVDSSKYLKPLATVNSIPGINLKVIHLIRDVRSWTVSMRDIRRKSDEFYIKNLVKKYGLKAAESYLKGIAEKYFWQWYLYNKKIQNTLQKNQIKSFQVGYEELCLYPELSISKICDFLEVEFVDSMLFPEKSQSKNILGNRMRTSREKRQRIFYDNRWFYKDDWLRPSFLFPNIMQYNNREVYKNTINFLWDK